MLEEGAELEGEGNGGCSEVIGGCGKLLDEGCSEELEGEWCSVEEGVGYPASVGPGAYDRGGGG